MLLEKTEREREITSLEQTKKDKEAELARLETEKNQTLKDKENKEKELAELYQKGLDSDKAKIKQLEAQVFTLTSSYETNQKALNTTNLEKDKNQNEIDRLKNLNDTANSQISNLNSRINSLTIQYDQSQAELTKAKTATTQTSNHLQNQINSLNATNQSYLSQNTSLNQQLNQERANQKNQSLTISSLNGQVSALNSQVSSLRNIERQWNQLPPESEYEVIVSAKIGVDDLSQNNLFRQATVATSREYTLQNSIYCDNQIENQNYRQFKLRLFVFNSGKFRARLVQSFYSSKEQKLYNENNIF